MTPSLSGVTLGREPSVLVDRALDLLSGGPADPVTVVARVCQIPSVPAALAEHLAAALLAVDDRFERGADGRWQLIADAANVVPVAPTRSAVAGARTGQSRLSVPARPRPSAAGRLSSSSFVVVDVETTGTRAYGGDRILEIAAVRVADGRAEVLLDTLVNPGRPIPAFVTRLTSIDTAMIRAAPTFADVATQVVGALEGHVFVAHNVGFDWRFVSMELQRATGRPLIGPRLCTVRMAKALVPQLRRRSLDHLAYHYDIEIKARHRAGGDALATASVLLRLLRAAEGHGCETIGDLESLTRPALGRRRRRRRARPYSASDDSAA